MELHLNMGGHLKKSYYILKSAATQETILILSLDAGEIIYISEEGKNIDWENTLNSYIMGIN